MITAPIWLPSINAALPYIGSAVLGTGAAVIFNANRYGDVGQKAQNYNNKRKGGEIFVRFSDQGREVMPPRPA